MRTVNFYDVTQGWVEITDFDAPFSFLCDIDGTIADNSHRQHWVASKPKNWDAYNEKMFDDGFLFHVGNKVKEIISWGCTPIFLTGRNEQYRQDTSAWLTYWDLPSELLYMRAVGDHRDDTIVKKELYHQVLDKGYLPRFVLDDRNKVVDMWRSVGIVCIQVAEGDF